MRSTYAQIIRKINKQNSENFIKIGWKIKKLWNSEVFQNDIKQWWITKAVQKMKNLTWHVKIYGELWGNDTAHSLCYSCQCFIKICRTSKFHNFLIFRPILMKYLLFVNFSLYIQIHLKIVWTAPLKVVALICKQSKSRNEISSADCFWHK